jgi:ubiquinone/menaquinone biosynthesis C-methylase UbiE
MEDRRLRVRDRYVQAYVDHYAKDGLVAAGKGLWKPKLDLWYQIGYTDDMTVLDYGCGWGTMVQGIKNPALYQGVDIVPAAIDAARDRFPGVSFEVLQMGQLNIPPVDFIAAQSVFTHALREDAPICLSDLYRSLKPGGFGLIDILHKPGPDMLLLRYYDPDEWLEMLDTAGFTGTFIAEAQASVMHSYYKVTKV